MSRELRVTLDERLERLTAAGRRNMMDSLRLRHARIVGLRPAQAEAPDTAWIWFEASLCDYVVDERTGLLVDGVINPRRLREVWRFTRFDGRWVADAIDQKPRFLDTLLLPLPTAGAMPHKRIEQSATR